MPEVAPVAEVIYFIDLNVPSGFSSFSISLHEVSSDFIIVTANFSNNKLDILKYGENQSYIHILFEGKPNLNLANFVNGLKTLTSRNIRKDFQKELYFYYKEPSFWNKSYFVSIVNEQSEKMIEQYIGDQKN